MKKIKLNLKDKKINLIFTAVILLIAVVIGIVSGYEFHSFSVFQAQFYTANADEIQSFKKYSSSLAGTVGDSSIYIQHGTENTVALVRTADEEKYDSVEKIKSSSAKIVGISNTAQFSAGQATLQGKTVYSCDSKEEAIEKINNSTADVALLRYEDAKLAVENNENLKICEAEVEKVPKVLIMGGTHPNEPAGQLAATIFLENAQMERGTLFVITEVNKSAYTHSQPQEATSWYYTLETASGEERVFKYGSRATNTNQQWPNPDIYIHSSGQSLSSSEVRNINRAYPGSATGNYTERLAYAITQLVVQNDITLVVDLHEASPEYVTINAMIAHQDTLSLATTAGNFIMADYEATTKEGKDIEGVDISVEVSPTTLHGLTHRELGDYTNAYVILCETSNASQGKLRGKFTDSLIEYKEKDKFYEYVAKLDGLLYAAPVDIKERVARHVFSIQSIIQAFNKTGMSRTVSTTQLSGEKKQGEYLGSFVMKNIPSYVDFLDNGVGSYLKDLY